MVCNTHSRCMTRTTIGFLGYDNSHAVDVAAGPAKKSRRPKAFDHIDRRGKKSVAYQFTTPFQLVADFFAEVEKILKEEGTS